MLVDKLLTTAGDLSDVIGGWLSPWGPRTCGRAFRPCAIARWLTVNSDSQLQLLHPRGTSRTDVMWSVQLHLLVAFLRSIVRYYDTLNKCI